MYIVYDIKWATWDYSSHNNSPFKNIDNKVLTFANVTSFLLLLLIITKIYLTKKKSTEKIKKNKSIEIYLFALICLNGLFLLVVELLWEYGESLWNDCEIVYTVINFMWSLNAGKDCCMNILDIKKHIVSLFSKKYAPMEKTNRRKVGVTLKNIKM
ncbi:Hypothetical protein SRAE_2000520750 [Strongyloides ratti]|uniref:7TM GPCR serpentine receptor class x (Srx) domain-containing protein n=1 Tax=Strongyloides ratti TaxID=34506 RepID=A0A090LLI6_STRRB|nr:Hypothetical protein SRAE_2000520750 [Strongyloides ratti]CEF70580.1 Hypothetical protein SRAE_2000520750 [Strongyloides ratti]